MSHRTNLRPGPCAVCKSPVAAQLGTLEGPPWKVICQACLPFPTAAECPPIRLTMARGEKVESAPTGRLGGDRWTAYKNTMDRLGVRASKDTAGVWHNYLPISKAAELCKALSDVGFLLEVAPEIQAAIDTVARQVAAEVAAAGDRLEAVDAQLAKRGKALFPFQREGVTWLAPRVGALLGDDMGLGKSVQALAAIPAGAPVVVVCPAVAKGVWAREAANWRPDLRVTKVDGRGRFRWPAPGEILILNWEVLPVTEIKVARAHEAGDECARCERVKAEHTEEDRAWGRCSSGYTRRPEDTFKLEPAPFLADCPADLVVIGDEIHAAKNSKAQRTIRFRAIAKAARARGGRSWGLSATPLLNDPPELWAVLQAIGSADDAFGGWWKFAQAMGGQQKDIKARGGKKVKIWEWENRPGARAGEALRRVMLRRTKDEVLPQLPPKTYKTVEVELDDEELLAEMEAVQDEMDGRWDDYLDDGDGNRGDSPTRPIPFNRISALRARIARAKIASLLELVPEYEDAQEPLVVFSAHREPIETFSSRPGWATILGGTPAAERTRIEDAFQRGELKGVACTIKAGGVAITLTRAAHMIFVDREWTPALNGQAEDRCRRIGQERPVQVTDLVCAHQLDQQVTELLKSKQALISASVEAGRVRLGEHAINPAEMAAGARDALLQQETLREQANAAALARTKRHQELQALLAQLEADQAVERARAEAERLDPKAKLERLVTAATKRQAAMDVDAELRGPISARERWAADAIVQLADMDADYATEENGVGFSRDCVGVGHSLARQVGMGLTDRAWGLCVTVCTRFKRQVGAPPAAEEEAA